jgi:hypothetical protein
MPKQQNLVTIGAVPWSSGLYNQGGQATIPENSLWETKNVTTDMTGRMFKRQGAKQWGQTLYTPEAGGLQYEEHLVDLSSFDYSKTGTDYQYLFTHSAGLVKFKSLEVVAGSYSRTLTRIAQGPDGTVAAGESNECQVLLHWKANTDMPGIGADTADHEGFSVNIRSNHANVLSLMFLDNGIYRFVAGAYTNITGTDVDDLGWHAILITIITSTTGTIKIDNDTAVSFTFANYTGVTVGANQVTIVGRSNASAVYECQIDFLQYRSGSDTLTGSKVDVLKDWSSMKPLQQHLIAISGNTIYDDIGHSNFFKAIGPRPHGKTILVPWLSELLLLSSSDISLRWDGVDIRECPGEFPRSVIAGTSHQGRVFVTTADEPLRVYYSGANDLGEWTRDQVTASRDSGWFILPDPRGRKITAMRGDFQGLLIIWTESSTWIMRSGGDPNNDAVLQIASANVGCIGPNAHDAFGRDVIFLNTDGIYNLSTVQEFGDVSSAAMSAVIRGLWQSNNFIDQRRVIDDFHSAVINVPSQAKTYVLVKMQGSEVVDSILEFNHDTKQWAGPWEVECQSSAFVLLGNPTLPSLMVGDSAGRLATLSSDVKSDFDSTAYEFKIRSARLDCRSLSKELIRHYKTWRSLRLYILPRGDWDLDIEWNVDGKLHNDSISSSQNVYKEPLLDSTFSLGESVIGDSERIGIIHVTLDTRGRWLEFKVTVNAADEDVAIVGFEVDALVDAPDKEN